jgi:hypothetical protein
MMRIHGTVTSLNANHLIENCGDDENLTPRLRIPTFFVRQMLAEKVD